MRYIVTEADMLLDKPVQVLDHGMVVPLDYMGSDLSIVDAARTSYGKQHYESDEKNKKLIFRLLKDGHTSCLEMVEFKFFIKMPIFVMRQWVRHRTANLNEFSMRYTEAPEEYYIPKPEHIQYQDKTNKQGRKGLYNNPHAFINDVGMQSEISFLIYKDYIKDGMAKELARIILPVNTYTQIIWKIDLHNLLHFLKLRLHEHAQYEIRVFAEALVPFVKAVCPYAWEAFEEYVLYAKTFSKSELETLNISTTSN